MSTITVKVGTTIERAKVRNMLFRNFVAALLAIGALSPGVLRAQAPNFVQTNLVSDVGGLATITDSNLVNPWGVSHNQTSPFWVSNQGTSTATIYAVTGETNITKVNLVVTIPKTAAGPQGPTGQVNNSNASSFPVLNGDGRPAIFIFANLNGSISAWDKVGSPAVIQVTTPGAVYTGLAINGAQTRLYAANAAQGKVDVFDSTFSPLSLSANAFVDPSLPAGLVPFNVQDINGDVYVVYAPAGRTNQVNAQLGEGAVAVFDEDGNFIKQLVAGSRLAAPWGITMAPPSFGRFSNHLLVGNFSYLHSEINAFDPINGSFHGTIPISAGANRPGGLWAIQFGVGGNNGSPDILYFTDGINGEADGLFAAISPPAAAPENAQ
jgi:uncharacterized protein (TIGR03118 family)